VNDEDWKSIGQVVAEVHDIDDRLTTCRNLLESKGFQVVVEPDPRPVRRLLQIYHLHAQRAHR
jgi:hypothetical protein